MNKIPSWAYIGIVAVIGIVFLGALVATQQASLTAQEKDMVDLAVRLGLDEEKFKTDLTGKEVKNIVDTQKSEAEALQPGGISTPAVFIDGIRYENSSYGELKSFLEKKIAEASEEELPVVVDVFTDYNCPACANFAPFKKALAIELGDDVQVNSKHSPFLRPSSTIYAQAAEAARMQSKFDEFDKELYLLTNPDIYTSSESLLSDILNQAK